MKADLPNRKVMVKRYSSDAAVIVQLASYEQDNFPDAVLDTAMSAARHQLAGSEHNLHSLKIGGLNTAELTRPGLSFKSPDVAPNMLQLVADDFFASSHSSHIC